LLLNKARGAEKHRFDKIAGSNFEHGDVFYHHDPKGMNELQLIIGYFLRIVTTGQEPAVIHSRLSIFIPT